MLSLRLSFQSRRLPGREFRDYISYIDFRLPTATLPNTQNHRKFLDTLSSDGLFEILHSLEVLYRGEFVGNSVNFAIFRELIRLLFQQFGIILRYEISECFTIFKTVLSLILYEKYMLTALHKFLWNFIQ